MTSSTTERTFSTLRRLKNYLQCTMTQEQLNHVILLHTHKDCTDNINLLEIAKSLFPLTTGELIFLVIFDV